MLGRLGWEEGEVVGVGVGVESGDWLICMRILGFADEAVAVVSMSRGCEKAPVDAFCSFSKSSCSFLGRRGGAGPRLKEEVWRVDVVKARRERRRGRRDVIVYVGVIMCLCVCVVAGKCVVFKGL